MGTKEIINSNMSEMFDKSGEREFDMKTSPDELNVNKSENNLCKEKLKITSSEDIEKGVDVVKSEKDNITVEKTEILEYQIPESKLQKIDLKIEENSNELQNNLTKEKIKQSIILQEKENNFIKISNSNA